MKTGGKYTHALNDYTANLNDEGLGVVTELLDKITAEGRGATAFETKEIILLFKIAFMPPAFGDFDGHTNRN